MRPVRALASWGLGIGLLASGVFAQDAQVKSGGATIEVNFGPGKFDVGREAILGWITNAANAASEYFGRFPVPLARVLVRPAEGRGGVFHGTTFGGARNILTTGFHANLGGTNDDHSAA
jgi:hypothetical protein